ncbi:nitrous oxide reductase accessory protein NosL [Geobacter sulfurreducens]|jgi:copper chaperone NosL|uniref:NosL family protein n=1 Tax=Geobacter sulfurreducens (strain ATCC 51573 / DSM 12127 / PCA) TaxID=243231 RepID=Q74DQ7_GEOSL|nr:nitrous oxide reductase accessory protein NosL [Geobacter sulfurreducens]AAR34634.1 NosL family protein [Geobacter sulfurreducens PCA]ADI84093.1 NosL family protein [Geobacter sulfurreducens KN400]QVW36473.1 nitrous oxide reductase accessory protein NosL [Geobacter sulfurreducens]UAC05287.1 nitrous oxide reductase accessory protein NosL [Geobacter sulfurreducens]UTG93924.1 nitrous oxide reductase accessory protein NosL [Geobacter sulfurreducens]
MNTFLTMLLALVLTVGAVPASGAGTATKLQIAPRDKCPVCGMFVAKFPSFAARITYRDGSYAVFDGAKDMFTYYLNLKKYAPGKSAGQIASILVTDYYGLSPIDGMSAHYVIGSDVLGPMGHELIPFARPADAEEFKKDHRGTRIVRFRDVNAALIAGLD